MIKEKYIFESHSEEVTFIPVEDLFTEEELSVIGKLDIIPHECHRNAYKMCLLFKDCGYCEGIFYGCMGHAFNYRDVDGRRCYFDITDYRNNGETSSKHLRTVLMRTYTAENIFKVFRNFKMYFVTVEVIYNRKYGTVTIGEDGFVVKLNDSDDVYQHILEKLNTFKKIINE